MKNYDLLDLVWDLVLYNSFLFLFLCLSLLFYDALIPKTNFKVFKEKIFLKIAIFCLSLFIVIGTTGIKGYWGYASLALLVIQILYSLYNRKKFQAWRKFDYCCVMLIAGIFLCSSMMLGTSKPRWEFMMLFPIIVSSIFPILLIASIFFAFKFSQRFYFYLKERKLRRALKKKTKEDSSNQEAQKEGYKQKNLEEKSNE